MLKSCVAIFVTASLLCPAPLAQDDWPFASCKVDISSTDSMADVIFKMACGKIDKPKIQMKRMKLDEFYSWMSSHLTDPFKIHELLYGNNIIWAATQRNSTTGVYEIRYWGDISDTTLAHEIMHIVLWELFPNDISFVKDETLVWRLTNHFIQSQTYKAWIRAKGL